MLSSWVVYHSPSLREWKIFVKESEGVRVTLDDILVLNDEKAKDGFKEISSIPISFAAKSYRLKVTISRRKVKMLV